MPEVAVKEGNNRKYVSEILKISIPSFSESLFTTFTAIIDSRMVSVLGVGAISAVSVTTQPKMFILCAFLAINTVITSLTAKAIGKKDRQEANRVFLLAILCTTVLAGITGSLCVLLADSIMRLCNSQPDTIENSIIYFRIIMSGLLFNAVTMTINAVLHGSGHTLFSFISNVVSCSVNILLNYFLIGGNCGFPALGVAGAAIATITGQLAAMILSIIYMFNRKLYINLSYCISEKIRTTTETFKNLFSSWKPVFSENVFSNLGYLLVSIISASAGSFAMAIYSVGMHLLEVNSDLGSGLKVAATALVGREYGAENRKRMHDYSLLTLKTGLLVSVVLGTLIAVFGKRYTALFSNESDFIRTGAQVCILVGVICPIQTRQIALNGILQGMGEFKATTRIAIISMTLINPVVTFVLTIVLRLGVWGIWSGAFLSQLIRMLLLNRKYFQVRRAVGI